VSRTAVELWNFSVSSATDASLFAMALLLILCAGSPGRRHEKSSSASAGALAVFTAYDFEHLRGPFTRVNLRSLWAFLRTAITGGLWLRSG
jgi:hypothetical protein